MRSANETIWMVTGNGHKYEEARSILGEYGIVVRQKNLGKVETQSDSLTKIAIHALQQLPLTERKGLNLIVEDSGLFVEALNGFPGPYSSYAFKTIGTQGVLKLLGTTRLRAAYFESAVALSVPKKRPELFVGRTRGHVALERRGKSGFGFDPIFVPIGGHSTFAEMDSPTKNKSSHRAKALRRLAARLVG